MPESPPKRMTRARAAKVTEESTIPLKSSLKKTKPSALAATTKPTTAKPKTTTRTKANVIEEEDALVVATQLKQNIEAPKAISTRRKAKVDDGNDEKSAAKEPTVTTKAGRGRPKKEAAHNVDTSQSKAVEIVAPKKKAEVPKATRGRPKKVTTEAEIKEPSQENDSQPKRATRTRATGATATTKSAAAKKKVTFKEENLDKENRVPLSPKKDEKLAPKEIGLKAKPVRKPGPVTRTTRRGKQAEQKLEEGEKPKPLSPKKATQVGSTSVASEDELASAEKTPVRLFSRSPVKMPSSVLKVSKLELGPHSETQSPPKELGASIMASPARRPPQSPYKNSLKESPQRTNLGESLLSQKPLKVSLSAMKQSTALPASPLKASVLNSPARRPPASAFKSSVFGSQIRSTMKASSGDLEPANNFKLPDLTPSKTFSSSLRAARSPEQLVRVHRMTTPEMMAEELGNSSAMATKQLDTIHDSAKRPVSPTKSTSHSPSKSPIKVTITISPERITQASSQKERQKLGHDDFKEIGVDELCQPVDSYRSTTPPGSVPKSVKRASFAIQSRAAEPYSDDDSEDELCSSRPTPVGQYGVSTKDLARQATPTSRSPSKASQSTLKRKVVEDNLFEESMERGISGLDAQIDSMAPLIDQMSTWKGASPDKTILEHRKEATRSIFTPSKPIPALPSFKPTSPLNGSPAKNSFFEDEMDVRSDDDVEMGGMEEEVAEVDDDALSITQAALSEPSQEYGDENVIPVEPVLLAESPAPTPPTATCTPARVFEAQRTFHTVSKVPLKAACEASPLRPILRRSKSVSGPLTPRKESEASPLARSHTVIGFSPQRAASCSGTVLTEEYTTPTKPESTQVRTPGTVAWSTAGTPARTPRRDLNPETLKGAIVFVDVHTTEGADASGIFVELLTQMGARCVKQWSWNPRASLAPRETPGFDLTGTAEGIREPGTPGAQKIGITHVVFKDGGKRTLEKVRAAGGVVTCVGVGWVLDCERSNTWLPETSYLVDTSNLPRGGHRRRKSMEPRALQNLNGTLVPSTPSATTISSSSNTDISPTKEFLTFPSSSRRASTAFIRIPSTPQAKEGESPEIDLSDLSPASPTTPGWLLPKNLSQRTCPPKHYVGGETLFPVTGRIEDCEDENVRRRLVLARRKSLQFAPKVGSPLGQPF
ncbi:MAG: hypothetical protein M1824_005210 [Vezdaea acicularis]|nr:MAG: hypothetical protein M1824_005210 [Vezdaea acicularis]